MTINLEKALIRQNKKIATPKELLLIQEYDRVGTLTDDETLTRIGINDQLKKGKEISHKILKLKGETIGFNQDRVFHISQIKQICMKYYLRFLPSEYYEGVIDEQLPAKINQFEIAYNVQCNKNNSFIVAPASSFRLEKRPKDPLFFYKINDEYYYLVHKWGNDLSVFRRLKYLLANAVFCRRMEIAILAISVLIAFAIGKSALSSNVKPGIISIPIVLAIITLVLFLAQITDDNTGWLEPNNWNSKYL